jgi:hypothetical protein
MTETKQINLNEIIHNNKSTWVALKQGRLIATTNHSTMFIVSKFLYVGHQSISHMWPRTASSCFVKSHESHDAQ